MTKTESVRRKPLQRLKDVVVQSKPSQFLREQVLKIEPIRKGAELREAIRVVAEDRGLAPEDVEKFLSTEKPKGFGLTDGMISGFLFLSFIATLSILNDRGSSLPEMGQFNSLTHSTLNAIHSITNYSAETLAVRDHLPFILLDLSIAYGGGKALTIKLIKKILGTGELLELQDKVKNQMEEGELPVKMNKGHSAIFSGYGDLLAKMLREKKGSNGASEYANQHITPEIWHKFDVADRENVFKVLDQGDFSSAGEAVILPVKEDHMFLAPQEGGHDMTLPGIMGLIAVLDEHCEDRGLEKKKVIIVGRKSYSQTYIESSLKDGKLERESTESTLNSVAETLNKREGSKRIEIIDPTELVMKKIFSLAEGRRLLLKSTQESDHIYGEDFHNTAKKMKYKVSSNETVSVYYNISDIPTTVSIGDENAIAVILDTSQKSALLKKGVSEDRILVVPELVSAELDRITELT